MFWSTFRGLTTVLALSALVSSSRASASAQCPSKELHTDKPRVLVLTDIENEPDDAQSLVRLLLYSHQFQLEGLVASTSYWLNNSVCPEKIHEILDAYEAVLPNLKQHADGWPEIDYLRKRVTAGLPVYGMEGVGEGKDSGGSNLLIDAVDSSDKPLWVPVWGGASILAQALWKVDATRSPAQAADFVSKLRIYAISDQDNTGAWIRRKFPHLFYIASVHHFNRYALAAWAGIAGGQMHYFWPCGADSNIVGPQWLKEHVQDVGPLGAKYPDTDFISEGSYMSKLSGGD